MRWDNYNLFIAEFNELCDIGRVCKSGTLYCRHYYCEEKSNDKLMLDKLNLDKSYSYGNIRVFMNKYKLYRPKSFYERYKDIDDCYDCKIAKGYNSDDSDFEDHNGFVDGEHLSDYADELLNIPYKYVKYLSTALIHYFAEISNYNNLLFKHILLYCFELEFWHDRLISHTINFECVTDATEIQSSITYAEYTAKYSWNKRRYPIVAIFI